MDGIDPLPKPDGAGDSASPDDSPDDSPDGNADGSSGDNPGSGSGFGGGSDGDLATIEEAIAEELVLEESGAHVEAAPKARGQAGMPTFTVVGIGASAGGLHALQRFFAAMPGDTGMAFVVVVHLSPEHESHLGPLLQSHASMPMVTVKETTKIEPNVVYVIPPGSNLSAVDSHLRLDPQEAERGARAD